MALSKEKLLSHLTEVIAWQIHTQISINDFHKFQLYFTARHGINEPIFFNDSLRTEMNKTIDKDKFNNTVEKELKSLKTHALKNFHSSNLLTLIGAIVTVAYFILMYLSWSPTIPNNNNEFEADLTNKNAPANHSDYSKLVLTASLTLIYISLYQVISKNKKGYHDEVKQTLEGILSSFDNKPETMTATSLNKLILKKLAIDVSKYEAPYGTNLLKHLVNAYKYEKNHPATRHARALSH